MLMSAEVECRCCVIKLFLVTVSNLFHLSFVSTYVHKVECYTLTLLDSG